MINVFSSLPDYEKNKREREKDKLLKRKRKERKITDYYVVSSHTKISK